MKRSACLLLVLVTSVVFGQLRADFNLDGSVDNKDFAVFASEWLMEESMANKRLFFTNGDCGVTFASPIGNVGAGSFSIVIHQETNNIANATLLRKWTIPGPYKGYMIQKNFVAGGYFSLTLTMYDGAVTKTVSTGNLTINVGRFIVFVIDRATGYGTAYVNNVAKTPVNISAMTDTLDSTANFEIGQSFHGYLDDIRIYPKALSVAEIANIYKESVGTKYTAAISEGGEALFALNCDGDVIDAVSGIAGVISQMDYVDGGPPFLPQNTDYYVIKRGEYIIDYVLDPLSRIAIFEDISALPDGSYNYTITPVSRYGISGPASEPLTIHVSGGQIQTMPSFDPNSLAAYPIAAGKFQLRWKHPSGSTTPEKFNVYYLDGVDWVKDGELSYYESSGFYIYTTAASWAHAAEVQFKVKPQRGAFEKDNAVIATGTADAQGPVISVPTMTITAA